jgi:hypothetical protein
VWDVMLCGVAEAAASHYPNYKRESNENLDSIKKAQTLLRSAAGKSGHQHGLEEHAMCCGSGVAMKGDEALPSLCALSLHV